MVTRTPLGLFLQDTLCGMLTKKYDVEIVHAEIFKDAMQNYEGVTLFSSHVSFKDILATDYALRNLDEEFPVFVLRNDLSFVLPQSLSQRVMIDHCKGVALDQKTLRFSEVVPSLKEAYVDGHAVVVYPGATREGGYLNDLIPTSVGFFSAELQRNGLSHHALLPLGIRYLGKDITLTFGDPYENDAYSPKELGKRVQQDIVKLATHPKEVVLSYIKTRV